MNSASIAQHTPAAQQALGSFLTTLLGREPSLEIHAATATELASVQAEAMTMMAIFTEGGPTFTVLLEVEWLPLLAESMLGEAVAVGDPGYEDLACELSGQAYGTIRTQLSGAGISLPDTRFDVTPPGQPFPTEGLSGPLLRVPFSMTVDDKTLSGFTLIPGSAEAPAQPAPAAPAMASPPAAAAAGGRPMGVPTAAPQQSVPVSPLAFPDLGAESFSGDGGNGHPFGLLAEVELEVTVELGRRRLPLADILRLTTGSVIELEKLVGEPLEVYANGRLIAEGEAVVIDEQFGIRITSLVTKRKRDKAFR